MIDHERGCEAFTWVIDVVLGVCEDFKRTSKVKKIHVLVHGDENLDGLVGVGGVLNCTHLAGCRMVQGMREGLD